MASDLDFESLVSRFYEPLYRFALSLARSEAGACDLTQQTFYLWATRGHQLRDSSKVKSWLFTTLHREFLQTQRHRQRFPEEELDAEHPDLPVVASTIAQHLDARQAVEALGRVDAVYQAPVALFYLEDYAYKEIAQLLEIPLGTVKSRIARGLAQLQMALARDPEPRHPPRSNDRE
ncbi:MAG: RNA polymerase sigma factor [Verrucomicrobiota bacterium]|jgi:RNA polymerase sigma-70 factor (ECF subfamily)